MRRGVNLEGWSNLADAHRGGKGFIVRTDEKLTRF
jgi:hypothetical protein